MVNIFFGLFLGGFLGWLNVGGVGWAHHVAHELDGCLGGVNGRELQRWGGFVAVAWVLSFDLVLWRRHYHAVGLEYFGMARRHSAQCHAQASDCHGFAQRLAVAQLSLQPLRLLLALWACASTVALVGALGGIVVNLVGACNVTPNGLQRFTNMFSLFHSL